MADGEREEVRLWSVVNPGPDQIAMFDRYRDYVKHENDLINHRVTWFIQLHAFLIASYGVVFGSLVSSFTLNGTPLTAAFEIRLMASSLLVGIALIGWQSALAAVRAIDGANDAIVSLDENWLKLLKGAERCAMLPHIVHGDCGLDEPDGSRKPRRNKKRWGAGASLHFKLPRALIALWCFSFFIPAAFGIIAAHSRGILQINFF